MRKEKKQKTSGTHVKSKNGIEIYISLAAFFISCIATYYSYTANKIAKENFNPYLKIEYLNINGFSTFANLWNSPNSNDSTFRASQLNGMGIENILWKIESESIKILFDSELFQKSIEDIKLIKSDSLLEKLIFEVIHIKNVTNTVAKNIRFVITEENQEGHEAVNEFNIDAALNNESIILLSKIYIVNNVGDTVNIGPKTTLERILYDGFDKDLVRQNRERFKENHIVKSVEGNSLIAQCPFVYTRKGSQWALENPIIVGIDDKSKEKMTRISLNHFDGSIKILEIEKETSYINQLYIQAITANSDTLIYRPNIKSLINDDNDYLILNQHQSVIIDFLPKISLDGIKNMTLYSKGYYIPYSKSTSI